MIFDQARNLYGTTTEGGNLNDCGGRAGCGTVFQPTPNSDGSWTETVLHHFTGGKDGADPAAGLIFEQAGNLYGTTTGGGNLNYCNASGCGVVFKLEPNSKGGWTETVLQRVHRPCGSLHNCRKIGITLRRKSRITCLESIGARSGFHPHGGPQTHRNSKSPSWRTDGANLCKRDFSD